MKQLYMRLDVGFTTADLGAVARLVGRWLGMKLRSDNDLELGGHFFSYFPKPLPDIGLCGVRVRQNYVEGIGRRLPHRPELPVCAEVEVCGPDLLELGRLAARARAVCGKRAVIATYVVTRSPLDLEDPVLPRAHFVDFGPDGQPIGACPKLRCHVAFGFATDDLSAAGAIGTDLFKTTPAEHESEDLGGRFLEFAGATRTGLVRRNQLSPGLWLYPRHRQHTLLLDINWRTANLLELGEQVVYVEEHLAQLSPLGYRVVGDLVRDRVPRMFTYELEA